jgi:hypothetical protein
MMDDDGQPLTGDPATHIQRLVSKLSPGHDDPAEPAEEAADGSGTARSPLLLVVVGGNGLPVTLDLAGQLVDVRDTATRLFNGVVAGVNPSTADWRELADELCVVHLLWSCQTGLRGTGHRDQKPA